jgi:hypothetical protein
MAMTEKRRNVAVFRHVLNQVEEAAAELLAFLLFFLDFFRRLLFLHGLGGFFLGCLLGVLAFAHGGLPVKVNFCRQVTPPQRRRT